MTQFEIFLLSPDDQPIDTERIFSAFHAVGKIRQTKADSTRFVYHNLDTGVFFNLWMSALHAVDAAETELESEEAKSDSTGEVEDAESSGLLIPPLTITIPLLCPSFFGPEAVAAVWQIAGHAGLKPEAPHSGETPEEFCDAWSLANRTAAQEPGCRSVTRWTPAESENWYQYGLARSALEAELADESLVVPRLQAAEHDGRVKTLCAWAQGTPTVLPRTELVLFSRERTHRGLLFSRKVTEEGLVSGEKLWQILAPSSEVRGSPVPLLIFREARSPPQRVAAELEVLELEPVDRARRTELLGVVDFDVTDGKESHA